MSTRVYEGPGKSEDIERGAPGPWAVSDPWCGKQGRRHWRRSACEGRPWREGWNRGIPYLIVLQKCAFYKLKARPSSKKITTCFIKSLALLWWSATEPTISPRYVFGGHQLCNELPMEECSDLSHWVWRGEPKPIVHIIGKSLCWEVVSDLSWREEMGGQHLEVLLRGLELGLDYMNFKLFVLIFLLIKKNF